MQEVMVDFAEELLGECGYCHGSFLYTIRGLPDQGAVVSGAETVRGFLVGNCPLCNARYRIPVNSN